MYIKDSHVIVCMIYNAFLIILIKNPTMNFNKILMKIIQVIKYFVRAQINAIIFHHRNSILMNYKIFLYVKKVKMNILNCKMYY